MSKTTSPRDGLSTAINCYRDGRQSISDVADILYFLSRVLDDVSGSDLLLSGTAKDGLSKLLNIAVHMIWEGTDNMPTPDALAQMCGIHLDSKGAGNDE